MSKSGLFAHFGSKQELQLATMEAAGALFSEQVLEPGLAEPTAIARLRRLASNYLDYVERDNFPGGCFFASVASEMDTHPGPVRDVAVAPGRRLGLLATTVREAQAEGTIDSAVTRRNSPSRSSPRSSSRTPCSSSERTRRRSPWPAARWSSASPR